MVQEIYADSREDGTTVGMHGVQGYYSVDNKVSMQQRFYDVKSDEDAISRAKKDGLIKIIMVEVNITEMAPCTLHKLNLGKLLA